MTEERIVAPDPVHEPEEYKAALLALLGEQDPVDVLAATPRRVESALAGASADALTRNPAPGEWSALEVVAHLFAAEVVYSFRWRLTLAQPGAHYSGYDQDAWAKLPLPPQAELVSGFTSLRRLNLALFATVSPDQWRLPGFHAERGPEPLDLSVALVAGHDLAHLRQLDETLEASRRG